MLTRYSSILLCALLVAGCARPEYSPVSMDAARAVKSGTPLVEVVSALGEPHPPTPTQASHLEGVVSKMPALIRANAQQDKSLAWGNDTAFLVVKVNDQGVVWVTAMRSSGS